MLIPRQTLASLASRALVLALAATASSGAAVPALVPTGMPVAAVGAAAAPHAVQATIWVSPTGPDSAPGTQAAPTSIRHAQQLVQNLNNSMTGDIDVMLTDGVYRLAAPLSLGPGDSGSNGNNVVWTAASGARPVLSGAAQIQGWSRLSASSPIYVAQAPSGLQTRQLYVNGSRVARAHGAPPNALSGQNASGYSGGGSTLAGWTNPSGAKPQLEF